MKHKAVIVFSVFVLIIIANGLGSVAIVDWSDVERIAVYDEYATLGSTVTIEYYVVNDRPVDVQVENIPWFSTRILWSLESNPLQKTSSGPTLKYLVIPAKDRVSCDSETIYIKKTGYVVVQKTGFPDVRIDVVDES